MGSLVIYTGGRQQDPSVLCPERGPRKYSAPPPPSPTLSPPDAQETLGSHILCPSPHPRRTEPCCSFGSCYSSRGPWTMPSLCAQEARHSSTVSDPEGAGASALGQPSTNRPVLVCWGCRNTMLPQGWSLLRPLSLACRRPPSPTVLP